MSAAAVVRRDHLGRWWSIDDASHVVEGFAWEDGALRRLCRHGLPFRFEARDLTGDERRVFVGGCFRYREDQPEDYGPSLLACPIDGAAAWQRLDVFCPPFLRGDKAFDGVVVVGNELIGVDDVVRPKFIDRYDLSQDPPVRCGAVEMPPVSNERTEHGVAVNGEWLAVRARSSFDSGVRRSITLYRLPDLRPTARFRETRLWSAKDPAWMEMARAFRCYGVAFVGAVLVIACGAEGLALINCSDIKALPPKTGAVEDGPWDLAVRKLAEEKQGFAMIHQLVELDARARWLGCAEGRRCVDVVAVPSREGVVVVEEHGDARTARWVAIAASAGP